MGKRLFKGNCFACGQLGHHSFKCPKNKGQQAASLSSETMDLAALCAEIDKLKEQLNTVTLQEKKEGF